MIDLLFGGLIIITAGFIAAEVYAPPFWLVALVWLGLGLRMFARGLRDREDRQFGRTIEQYRDYKADLRERNG